MKITSLLTGAWLMTAVMVCESATLVGSVIPPYPDGWKEGGGVCIAQSLGMERMCSFSMGILKSADGKILYVGKLVSSPDAKLPLWLVTDEMPYPVIPRKHYFTYVSCEKDGKSDETIMAIVKRPRAEMEWHDRIHTAYRVNLDSGRFEKISSKGVRCLNEGWGL
jgi:hypothetical protein